MGFLLATPLLGKEDDGFPLAVSDSERPQDGPAPDAGQAVAGYLSHTGPIKAWPGQVKPPHLYLENAWSAWLDSHLPEEALEEVQVSKKDSPMPVVLSSFRNLMEELRTSSTSTWCWWI